MPIAHSVVNKYIYTYIYISIYIYIFAYIYTHIHIHIRPFAPVQVHKSFCGFTHPGTCVVSKSLCIVRSVHSSLLELLCGSLHVGLFRMLCSHHVSSCTTLCLSCCSLAGVTGSVLSSYSDASEGRLRAPAAAAVGSGALRWAWRGEHGIGEPWREGIYIETNYLDHTSQPASQPASQPTSQPTQPNHHPPSQPAHKVRGSVRQKCQKSGVTHAGSCFPA